MENKFYYCTHCKSFTWQVEETCGLRCQQCLGQNEFQPAVKSGEEIAIEWLRNIAYPLKYLQQEAAKEGAVLNSNAPLLCKDGEWLQGLAQKALAQIASIEVNQKESNMECFAIKNGEAYIGFKLPNGNFHFIQIPYTEPIPKSSMDFLDSKEYQEEKRKAEYVEELKQVASDAWKWAANVHLAHPNDEHTFEAYWKAFGKKDAEVRGYEKNHAKK